jgi:hypothetical protein
VLLGRSLALTVFAAMPFDGGPADGPRPRVPMEIVATGDGPPVRVRVVSAAVTVRRSRCDMDSLSDRLVDAKLSAGDRIDADSPTRCVCYAHTQGAFRDSDFTLARVACASGGRIAIAVPTR